MKQRLLLVLMAAAIPLMTFSACSYDPSASATTNAANAWNAPTTQQEVSILTQIGTSALNAWLSNATKGRHASKETFIDQQTNLAVAKHPDIPRAKIRKAIVAKLKTAPG